MVDYQSNQSYLTRTQSNTIEYYPGIGRSIEIRLHSTIESQLFDRVRLRSIGSIAIFVRSCSIDTVWSLRLPAMHGKIERACKVE